LVNFRAQRRIESTIDHERYDSWLELKFNPTNQLLTMRIETDLKNTDNDISVIWKKLIESRMN